MSFNILDLLSEAKGETPVKFTMTCIDSKPVYFSVEKRAAQPKPEHTTAELIAEKQVPKKDDVNTDTYRKCNPAKAGSKKKKKKKPLARARAKAEAEPKTNPEALYAQQVRSQKRSKAPHVTQRQVSSYRGRPILELKKCLSCRPTASTLPPA
ncbi:hypothetical protein PMIN07_011956 [Paraphaeosphaeria minitans]